MADVAAFVQESAAIGAPRPPNMERIVELNRGPFVGAFEPLPELPVPPKGTQVVDVRPVEAFAEGHLEGALSVPVDGTRFSTKAAFVLDPEQPMVVAATDEAEAERAVSHLRSVAVLDIAGFVLGGGPQTLDLVEVDQLDELMAEGAELIDVREKDERDAGYIAGSRNIPYRLLALGGADLPRDRPLVTICESGPRAAIAASILSAQGFDARAVAEGGVDAWRASGKPTVEFRRCGS
jgi:hydroxyacylglutathione hydrolase